MIRFSLFKNFVCAALVLSSLSVSAAEIRANAGTTFDLYPTADPGVLTHTVDGVVQVSRMGNCKVHFDVVVTAKSAQVYSLKGSLIITSATGAASLKADVEGYGIIDPANASFLNIHYEVTFTGGSGAFTAARGRAQIDGFAMFTDDGLIQPAGSYATGKATWLMQGDVRE
jgi:hypothetical protein